MPLHLAIPSPSRFNPTRQCKEKQRQPQCLGCPRAWMVADLALPLHPAKGKSRPSAHRTSQFPNAFQSRMWQFWNNRQDNELTPTNSDKALVKYYYPLLTELVKPLVTLVLMYSYYRWWIAFILFQSKTSITAETQKLNSSFHYIDGRFDYLIAFHVSHLTVAMYPPQKLGCSN